MKKKFLINTLFVLLIISFLLSSCKPVEQNKNTENDIKSDDSSSLLKVGMVTDSGTIDDKSFNQGTWEGIEKYRTDTNKIETKYLKPQGMQPSDYKKTISTLIDSKYDLIITSGFMFEEPVKEISKEFEDTSFVLIDGDAKESKNVVSVSFAAEESAFLAGISAALSTKTNKLGFVGGQAIPPVKDFEFGFKAGVKYAQEKLDSKAKIEYSQYADSFDDVAKGKTIASTMYSKDVDIIFHAAGGVGTGVITEAKERALKDNLVYVIGVDKDQYSEGIYKDDKSIILTSAMKRVDMAAYRFIDDKVNNKFEGGTQIKLSLKDEGVGLPEENPNLSKETIDEIAKIKKEVVEGKIVVPKSEEEVEKFLK
ncbi:MAG: BMP family ABC transporter substrate-binding protein [Clostridiales bacterium]